MKKLLFIGICMFFNSMAFSASPEQTQQNIKSIDFVAKYQKIPPMNQVMEKGVYEKYRVLKSSNNPLFKLNCFRFYQKNWDFMLFDPDGFPWWCYFHK